MLFSYEFKATPNMRNITSRDILLIRWTNFTGWWINKLYGINLHIHVYDEREFYTVNHTIKYKCRCGDTQSISENSIKEFRRVD